MAKMFLLTGATGLLGGYLLRDGLASGDRMVALVRDHRKASAAQRVKTRLASFEGPLQKTLNSPMPAPLVLPCNLNRENLGLKEEDIHWIAQHCHAIVHNAASLQFYGPDREGEPWRTNLDGTRRVLKLCRQTGIRQFHFVSTAYVCGHRSGCVLEDELDVGQSMGNDYERSKLEAEHLIRNDAFLESTTVYRPSVIIGDSRTSQTDGYHGFYSVLKLAHTLASRVQQGATSAGELAAALGLSNGETKHLVPVDWVSAVITHIRRNSRLHGRTYHLTARTPLPVAEMAAVIQEAIERYSNLADPKDPTRLDGNWISQAFRQQMSVYRAYWRDDPQFDQRNTLWAAGHLPCPHVDRKMLLKMARWAIESRFGRELTLALPRIPRTATDALCGTGSSECPH